MKSDSRFVQIIKCILQVENSLGKGIELNISCL